jgi:branched-chain amino acid transport system ATP-binding protein
MLKLTKVNVFYSKVHILKDIDLFVQKGEIVCLIGANGAGKSTLLLTISGIVKPSSGSIQYDGLEITNIGPDQIVRLGIVQSLGGNGLFKRMTVEDNLKLGFFSSDANEIKRESRGLLHTIKSIGENSTGMWNRGQLAVFEGRKTDVLEIFPALRSKLNETTANLSGGESAMLAIARALIADPTLLLLDEPSSGLAPLLVKQIFQVIPQLRGRGISILLVEQYAKKALEISDRAYILKVGTLAEPRPSNEIIGDPSIQDSFLGKSD